MKLGSAAAAAAKSLQSCPTLCDPIDGSPPGFPVPGIPQAPICLLRNLYAGQETTVRTGHGITDWF